MDEAFMVTSIELSDQELSELRDLTEQSDSEEAIRVAIRDYIRYARRARLKQLSGQVETNVDLHQLERSEICDHNDCSAL
jgi:hypothetical protein